VTPVEAIGEFIARLPDIASPSGVFVYGIATVTTLILIAKVLEWKRAGSEGELELADVLEEDRHETATKEIDGRPRSPSQSTRITRVMAISAGCSNSPMSSSVSLPTSRRRVRDGLVTSSRT
jgi:hypothetical protein